MLTSSSFLFNRFLYISIWGHNTCNLHIVHLHVTVPFYIISTTWLWGAGRSIVVVCACSSAIIIIIYLSLLWSPTGCAFKVATQYWQHLIWVAVWSFYLIMIWYPFLSLILEIVIDISITIRRWYQLCAIISWKAPFSLLSFMSSCLWHRNSTYMLV